MWHQPCQRCKYTTSGGYSKTRYKKLVTHVESLVPNMLLASEDIKQKQNERTNERRIAVIVQELCESRGGRPGLSVLTSLLVSVDVKLY